MVVGLRGFEPVSLGVRRRGGRRACVAGRERAAQQRERRTARRARRGVPLQRVSTTGGRPAKSRPRGGARPSFRAARHYPSKCDRWVN